MNRKIMLLPLSLAAAFGLVACGGEIKDGSSSASSPSSSSSASSSSTADSSSSVETVEISVDKTAVTIEVGDAELVTATVSGTDNKSVTWSSSDETVATVNSGLITGVKEGTATITVTSAADSTKKKEIAVTVTADPDALKVITIATMQEATPTYTDDKTATYSEKVAVEGRVVNSNSSGIVVYDGTGIVLVFSSSATKVAGVGEYVHVEGIPTRYKANDTDERWWQFDYNDKKLSVTKITHSEIALPTISTFGADDFEKYVTPAAGTVNYVSFTGKVEISGSYTNVYMSDYEGSKSFSYTSNVAVENGLTYNFKAFLAEIKSSKYLVCYVTEANLIDYDAVTSVTINQTATELYTDKTLALTASVLPATANPLVEWSSSDADVAKVDESGVVTGVAEGKATITATSVGKNEDGNTVKATLDIEVKKSDPDSLSLTCTFNSSVPDGWTAKEEEYSSYKPSYYKDGSLKVNYNTIYVDSPKFDAVTNGVTVEATVNALYVSEKKPSATITDDSVIYTVYGYGDSDEAICTKTITYATAKTKGTYTVSLDTAGITKIRFFVTERPVNDSGLYYNVGLKEIKVSAIKTNA